MENNDGNNIRIRLKKADTKSQRLKFQRSAFKNLVVNHAIIFVVISSE